MYHKMRGIIKLIERWSCHVSSVLPQWLWFMFLLSRSSSSPIPHGKWIAWGMARGLAINPSFFACGTIESEGSDIYTSSKVGSPLQFSADRSRPRCCPKRQMGSRAWSIEAKAHERLIICNALLSYLLKQALTVPMWSITLWLHNKTSHWLIFLSSPSPFPPHFGCNLKFPKINKNQIASTHTLTTANFMYWSYPSAPWITHKRIS